MSYQITITTMQKKHAPQNRDTVTEIIQRVYYEKFHNFFSVCNNIKPSKKPLDFRTFKNYYNQGLTPIQAVNKYFL